MQSINAVAVSPDGRRYAAAHDDGTVRIGELRSGNEILNIHAHAGQVWSIAWSPTGAYIASVGADRRVAMWNAFDGDQVFARETYGTWNVMFDPNGAGSGYWRWRVSARAKCLDWKGGPVGQWD